jgi:hypothetical protein
MANTQVTNKDIEHFVDDFKEMISIHMDTFNPGEFGGLIILHATKLLYDCAPHRKLAAQIIKLAIREGIKIHKEQKEVGAPKKKRRTKEEIQQEKCKKISEI